MKKIFAFVAMLFLAACGSLPGAVNQTLPTATDEPIGALIKMDSIYGNMTSAAATPTVDEVGTAMMVLAKDAATSTSAAQATGTSYVVTSTQEAKQTQAFWVGVTLAVGTQRATETQIAKTSVAGTQQAEYQTAVPLTATMLKATQVIQQDEFQARRISVWINRVSLSVFLLGIVGLSLFLLFKGVRFGEQAGQAKNLQAFTNALKPDEHGRHALVPASALNNDKLINPNLMHRSVLDPKAADDLTTDQALANTNSHKKLEAVRSISTAPMLRNMAKALMAPQQPAAPGAGDVKITKPDQPLLTTLPEMPVPSWKLLTKWDGELLPVGANEKGELMRIDPAQRAHLMYVGRSGTGKSLTGIRTAAACLLAQGWNVIVMGKRVDFMPFEDHPNFKLLAVDVRKSAGKYVDILNTLTAQMDIRDQIMAGKGVSTWERYGAAETMIILDDYSGAMLRMDKKFSSLMLNEVKQIAMDGRKFGLHLTIGLQRATWENIDTDLRSQMGRIVYSVESAGDSRVALGENGAEMLPAFRHFLTRMTDNSAVQRGVGFFLSDAEVETFLASRPVKQNEPLNWVDGEVKELPQSVSSVTQNVPAAPAAISQSLTEAREKADKTIQVQDMYIEYLNNHIKPNYAEIGRVVYGYSGGKADRDIKNAIALFENVPVEKLPEVIEKHMSDWSTTKTSTTGLIGLNSPNLDINPV